MSTIPNFKAVKFLSSQDEVNNHLSKGWRLIGVFQATGNDGDGGREQWPQAIVGKIDDESPNGEIIEVMNIHADEANKYLGKDGWHLLTTFIKGRNDGGDEYAICLLGRSKTGTQTNN